MADDRSTVYYDPDTNDWVYRASGLGDCVRALTAIASGKYEEARSADTTAMLNRTAEEGNIHEAAVIAKLSKEGWVWESTQTVADVRVLAQVDGRPGVVIRGHIDGRGHLPGDPLHLLEVKSMSNKRFDRWVKQGFAGFIKYAFQITSYMHAYPDDDVLYVVKRREDGMENRIIIPHDEPPVSWKAVRKKVLRAESYRRQGQLPPCDIEGSDAYFCPFFYLHDEKVDDGDYEMTDEMRILLTDLVPKRMELKGIEEEGKEAEVQRKAVDKEILNLMGTTDRALLEGEFEDYQITKVNSGGSSLDESAMRAELGDEVVDKYKKPYRYQYPKITPKKKKGSTP